MQQEFSQNLARGEKIILAKRFLIFLKYKIEITFNGVTTEVKAQGAGKGRVRIKSGFMRYLNSGVKNQKEIKIWVEDGFVHIGSLSFECDWDDISPKNNRTLDGPSTRGSSFIEVSIHE